MRTALLKAHAMWFVSEENKENASAFLGGLPNQVQVVPNAYACDRTTSSPWPRNGDAVRWAMVGRLECAQKGHDIVIDVLSRNTWRSRNLRVSFAGDGPHREMLAEMCRSRGLASVEFLGHVSDPCQIWSSHQVLLLPSRYEGQSLAMLEAMLHARPIIAAPAGGTRGLVIDGSTGFVSERADVDSFGAAMDRAWDSRGRLEDIGMSARAAAQGHVAIDAGADFADRILKVLPAPKL